MNETSKKINQVFILPKLIYIILIFGFIFLLPINFSISASNNNRSTLVNVSVWDGSVASSYKEGDGSVNNPFIISNAAELAYFSLELETNNYANTYFKLTNNIILNEGIFKYDLENGIQYILNNQTYYVDPYSNKYYDNINREGIEIGTINIFNSLDEFKGHFDGDLFTIYGLYITDENKDDLALFTNLEGNIHDLYVENMMVFGGIKTAGIASTTNNTSLSNIVFDGYVIGKNIVNGIAGGIIASANNTTIENIVNKAYVYGYLTSGGLVGSVTNNLTINQSYNIGNIYSEIVSGGLIGTIAESEDTENEIEVLNSYNSGDMYASNIGGLIGVINDNLGLVSINNVFNTGTTDYSIGTINNTVVNINNVYYVNGERAVGSDILLELEEYFTLTLLDNLMNKDYIVTNLLFGEFIDFNDLNQNPENVWVYENDTLPILFVENIMLDGYTQSSLTVGRNPTRYLDVEPYITNKSVVTLNFSYNHSSSELSGYTHNLMSNILLPLNTKITLIDHLNDKVFEYQIPTNEDNYNYENSCEIDDLDCVKCATYPFTLFKEVGTTIDKPFLESSYYNEGIINEEFTIILDFANTDIENNYENVTLYMELHDLNGNSVRPTLYNTIKKFNIYAMVDSENTNARIYLETDYSGNEIIYNSDFINNINITSSINYKLINGNKIIDTTYEDQSMGLIIKLVDSEGNIVHREYLKNIVFKVDDQIYYPGNDHLVRINLGSGQDVISKNILITTYENNSNLEEGTYYFKISNYTSLDGIHFTELGDTELNIPVEVTKSNPNIIYGFNVNIADNNRIINKTNEEANIIFNVLQSGSLEEANITVSLYRKDELTAYEQTYSIVDLANYINDELTIYEENIYSVLLDPETNSFTLNLITTNFENTGYKWVFDLYDGITKIGTIEKFFIVKEEEDEL